VHILTTRDAAGLPAAAVIYRMASRWREENYFRYARAHFAPDALDSYAVTPDNPQRLVPNPAKKTAAAAVKAARKALAEAEAGRQRKLDALHQPVPGSSAVITNAMLAGLDAPVAARRRLETAQGDAKATPAKIPLSQHNPGMVRLDAETKLITHAIRMAAYNAETILARALNGHYARSGQEAYALIREALTTSGDITVHDGSLHVACTSALTRCPRPAGPAPWPRYVSSSTPARPAIPAPRSPFTTRSKNTRPLHNLLLHVRSPEPSRGGAEKVCSR
jgi:hypothetical protein